MPPAAVKGVWGQEKVCTVSTFLVGVIIWNKRAVMHLEKGTIIHN